MINHEGKNLDEALPSMPVEILGMNGSAFAGAEFLVTENEDKAKEISEFKNENFSTVIGLGGGSSLDVAKYVGYKLEKKKIMIPTTFGSGSEVTKISVLNVDGKKTSFHDTKIISDVAIIDSNFIKRLFCIFPIN